MNSRKYNRFVVIEAPTFTDNNRGGRTEVWNKIGDAYAEMIPLRGDEALRLSIEQATQLWKVTIRYRTDIDRKHRLNWGGRILDIMAGPEDPDGRGRDLVMTCEEKRAP
jgi:SPP1 family predicted phage head-tail adaptor